MAARTTPTAADVTAAYAANLRLLRVLAREYRFHPLFFWQPVITTKRFKTSDERRWVNDYTSDPTRRQLLYDAIVNERRGHAELCGAADAIDLSGLFDDWEDPVYIDLYHLSEAGNRAVAEAMLPFVVAALQRLRPHTYVAAGRVS